MNKSLTDFLRTAMEPVGSTMYIWGGGWNSEDSGAGKDAKIIGVNPNWKNSLCHKAAITIIKNTDMSIETGWIAADM